VIVLGGVGLRPLEAGVVDLVIFSPLKGWLKNWSSYAHARFN
jgi:hypothetical protein